MEGEPPVKSERLDGEGVSGQPGPSPPPAASAPAPDPPEQVLEQEEEEEEEGVSRLQERVRGLMEEVSHLSAENRSLKQKSPDPEEGTSRLSAENRRLKQQVHVLREVTIHFLTENQQLKQPGQDPVDLKSLLPVEFPKVEQQDDDQDEVTHLSAQNQRLKEQVEALTEVVSHYLAENNQLKPQRPDREEPVSCLKQEGPLRNRLDGEGVPAQPGPSPLPSASAPALHPPEQVHEQEEEEEGVPHLSAKNQRLKRQVRVLWEVVIHFLTENQQLKQPDQDPVDLKSLLPVEFPKVEEQDHDQDEVTRLSAENQRLKEQVEALADVVSHNLAENNKLKLQRPDREEPVSRLKQEGPLRDRPGDPQRAIKLWASWPSMLIGRASDKGICVQFRISGKTGGCEEKFLRDVSELLSLQRVSLKVKEFKETSKDPLLLFCPIASHMCNDIENALEGLGDKQKVLLVVMHYVRKENPESSVNAKQPVTPPAVVRTVHTRFTLRDGFYPCQMNKTAVADVAAALKALAEDQ
uniref:Uncharacterized protein isoform X1 n=1 Tax=Pogona vitticeps TaxID=103695 RepID=A0ABM5F9H0_9SAUR